MKGWTLKVIDHDGERKVEGIPSGDAAKNRARQFKRYSGDSNIRFVVFDPQGIPYQYTKASGAARMRWSWSAKGVSSPEGEQG